MSDDNKSMSEILKEIREIVAEDEGAEGETAKDEATPVQPVRMIGFATGLFAAAPLVLLAIFWGHWLSRWLPGISEFQDTPVMIMLLVSIATQVGDNFRQPSSRTDWIILLATLFLAFMACTTTMAVVSWGVSVAAPDLNWLVSELGEVLFGLGALFATLWAASRLAHDRNLILPKGGEAP